LTGEVPPGAGHFSWTYAWTFASYAMTIRSAAAGNPTTEWLEGGQTSAPFALTMPAPPADRLATAWRYLSLGFTHIVPHGLDHMLFVLGIYLLSGRARTVLWQVSAFTLAHSITLGLSIYGIVAVPPAIVEPLIARCLRRHREHLSLGLKSWRVVLVFVFGLLQGWASRARQGLGLPRSGSDRAADVQRRGRGGTAGRDRSRVPARRRLLRQPRQYTAASSFPYRC
jgi:hypothetical protein